MTEKPKEHEELQKDEIFLGNTNKKEIPKYYSSLKTIRMGIQAYDINGEPLEQNYCRPLFLHKSEEPAYEAIMAERFKQASYGMLDN